MNMKFLVVGAAIAGFAGQMANAQLKCCAPPKIVAQQSSDLAQAEMKTVKLDIDGMTCGSCAASVTSALQKVEGVRNVQISFEQKGGTVEFDSSKVAEAKIVEAVNASGFKAQLAATEKSE